jgi:hypothetical protein
MNSASVVVISAKTIRFTKDDIKEIQPTFDKIEMFMREEDIIPGEIEAC